MDKNFTNSASCSLTIIEASCENVRSILTKLFLLANWIMEVRVQISGIYTIKYHT